MSVDLGTRNVLDLLQFLNKTSGGFTYISGLNNDTSAIYLEGKHRFKLYTATGNDRNRFFANSVDPDETAHTEPSHQDLLCLIFSFSTLHIKVFTINSFVKKKKQMTNVV